MSKALHSVSLDGMTALVTGTNQGIGRAIALALAAAGADVAVNDIQHNAQTDSLVEDIQQMGRQALVLTGDASELPTIEGMVGQIVERWGRLNIAVGNAAYSRRQLFWEGDVAEFRRTFEVTFWSAYNVLRAASRQMIAQGGGGSIVLISSPHAFLAVPRAMAYNAAKAGVEQLAKTGALELAEHRVRVNIVQPGWTDTPGERNFASEEQIQAAGPKLPYGRLARPEEVARAVVYFCEPASEYTTGSTLLVDGALSLPWWASRGSGVPE